MDLKSILSTSITDENVLSQVINSINAELHKEFIPKSQYNKKVLEIEQLNNKVLEAEGNSVLIDEYKNKYNSLQEEFNSFKTDLANKTTKENKSNKLKEKLKESGFTKDKVVKLMLNAFNLDDIQLNDNGDINDWNKISKGILDEYSDFKEVIETKGEEPKVNIGTGTIKFTKEQIEQMSTEEINKNWDNIQKSLKEI